MSRYEMVVSPFEVMVVDTILDHKLASFWDGFDGQYHPDPQGAAQMEVDRLNAQQPTNGAR